MRFYRRHAVYRVIAFLTVSAISLLGFHRDLAASDQHVIIGTGGVTGVYYPAGVAICKAINKTLAEHGLRCSAESTEGSVYNVDKIRSGDMDFGIVQSDVQYYAVKGFGPFKGKGPDDKLRGVFSLHSESFTVLARADAAIQTFDDLKGKRVNIGNPGSGQRTSMDLVMHAKGWTKDDFAAALELSSELQAEALCDNKIDAMVFTAGHPNASIKKATSACDAVLVEVTGPEIVRLITTYPYFGAVIIPAETYRGSPHRIRTFGVHATLVTSSDTPDKVVYNLVQAVFDDLIDFKFSHPAFFALVPDDMINKGQTAPMHPGAIRYFKNAGDLSHLLKIRRAPHR